MSSTIVDLPDGTSLDVDTDDPKVAAAAARKFMQREAEQARQASKMPSAPPSGRRQAQQAPKQSTWENIQDTFIDNVLPNWGDEIAGFGYGLGSVLSGKRSFGEGFREGQRRFKAEHETFSREHPRLNAAAATAGTGASIVLPAGRALRGASLGRKALQGAQVGAAYAAAAGAGEGDGLDLGRRASNAVSAIPAGAVVGAAIPMAAAVAPRLGRAARASIPGVDAAARTLARVPRAVIQAATDRRQVPPVSAGVAEANRLAGRRMTQGRIANGPGLDGPASSPQAIQQEVANRNAMGVPAMIGDVSEPMRGLTEWSSRRMGPGQTMVRDALARRKATEGARIRQHVLDTMPTTPDPIAFAERQRQAARDAAGPLYEQAYSQPMYRTAAIQGIEQSPAFRKALPQAYDNILNQVDHATGLPKSPTAMGFRDMPNADPNGLPPNVAYFPHPSGNGYVAVDPNGLSFEGYDQVSRAMRDAGKAAADRNPVTGRIEDTTNSVHINARANDLRSHLRDQNAAYDQAVGRYGDDMTYSQAFDQGGDVGNLTGHEVNAQLRSLPDQAHEAWATGAGTAMADRASQFSANTPNGDAANAVRKMLGDDIKQQAIGSATGNPGSVRDLLNRLEAEHQGHINWQGVNGNSATAGRQALDVDLDGAAGIPTPRRHWLPSLVDFVAAHANANYQRDVRRRIGEIVTASDPQSVGEVMQAIHDQATRDQAFGDLLHKAGVGASAVYGVNVAPVDPADQEDARGY